MKKILALIPARGGSKSLPGKNIKRLCGKPLIAWTIEKAKASRSLMRVVVSTDSPEIAEISQRYGAEVPFLRPPELSRNDSPTLDAVFHALDWFTQNQQEMFDAVALLEPTSPLRKAGDIDGAIASLSTNWDRADAVVTLGAVQLEHPFIVKKVEDGYVVPLITQESRAYQRQQLPPVYFPYGVMYLVKTETLRQERTFYPRRTIPYFIERWQNYEIDDLYDFLGVEAIMQYQREHP